MTPDQVADTVNHTRMKKKKKLLQSGGQKLFEPTTSSTDEQNNCQDPPTKKKKHISERVQTENEEVRTFNGIQFPGSSEQSDGLSEIPKKKKKEKKTLKSYDQESITIEPKTPTDDQQSCQDQPKKKKKSKSERVQTENEEIPKKKKKKEKGVDALCDIESSLKINRQVWRGETVLTEMHVNKNLESAPTTLRKSKKRKRATSCKSDGQESVTIESETTAADENVSTEIKERDTLPSSTKRQPGSHERRRKKKRQSGKDQVEDEEETRGDSGLILRKRGEKERVFSNKKKKKTKEGSRLHVKGGGDARGKVLECVPDENPSAADKKRVKGKRKRSVQSDGQESVTGKPRSSTTDENASVENSEMVTDSVTDQNQQISQKRNRRRQRRKKKLMNNNDQVGEESRRVSSENSEELTDIPKKKKKKKTKKSKKTEADEDTPEDDDKPGTSAAEGGETAADGDEKDAAVDSSDEEEETKEGIFAPFVSFYNNMLDPTYSAVTDVYVPMFLCDVFNFILFAVMSYSFGEEQAQTDVADMIQSNSISMFFVLFLLLQFVLMVIDRAIYLRKAVIAKFIFLIAVIIGVHVWLFFLLPKINNRRFIDNTPAQVFYFVKCVYFALSAYQIRCGYPTRILGNCLCKRYNYVNLFLFMGYQAIPFLKEIRMLMDWMFTDTTLSLAHWLEIEDVYSSVYPIKCWRNAEVAYPVDRGLLKSKAVKYGAGGIQLFFLLVIVWFPLLLISLSNSSNISNPISSVDISITISGYDPLFKMTTQGHSLIEFNQKKYDNLLNEYGKDLTAVSFLKMYKAEDLIEVNINGASASSWDVSPPSRNGLREHLLSMNVVEFRYAYSFKRNSDSSLVTPVVEGIYSFTLSATDPKEREIRKLLAEQLDTNVSSPVAIPRAYPGSVQVPAKGDAEPATKILSSEYSQGYSNITMKLEYGSIDGVGGEREWWVVNKDEDMMSILTFNDRVASDLFAPLAGYGIVGLYVTIVLVVGKFVRMMFSGVSQTIMFKEFPNVDRIVKLCLDIFLVRECGEMKLEEDLTAKLIFLYRSPAMLIEFTRYKRD
ncbi:piezo-type mechanosensitive ion channel component 2-like [Asterias rubens]|uniref:piezo-type mechanosensitive ion channel component 2-like n=1 Tax=Asterias rubens TaxID=7604 RepID=UPI001455C669|nr:piezo-type mechanosensitive ion channel component 2-like [Asterias rubens]